jgi:putative membrane protein insertion efficiency factor
MPTAPTLGQAVALAAIRLYRLIKQSGWLPQGVCRYVPTCSAYAEEAIRKHGFFKGTKMALQRILRCHPARAGGIDPVQ